MMGATPGSESFRNGTNGPLQILPWGGNNSVNLHPSWNGVRPAHGDNVADLIIPSMCGSGSTLYLNGTAYMHPQTPPNSSNGVTFELVQDGNTLTSLSFDGTPGQQKPLNVPVKAGNMTVHVGDQGNSDYDWFYVDASFYCAGNGAASE